MVGDGWCELERELRTVRSVYARAADGRSNDLGRGEGRRLSTQYRPQDVTTAPTVTPALVTPHATRPSLSASAVSLVSPVSPAPQPRLARVTPPVLGGLRWNSAGLSTAGFRSCRFVVLLFLIVLSVFVVFLWTISFLTYIASHMYLYIDEPVGLVVLATPVTFRPYTLA
jgi:hypothetical protein